MELRGFSTGVLYDSILELKKYFARGQPNGIVIKDYLSSLVLLMAPIAPHISEDIWHMMGNVSFSSLEKWPSPDESMISDKTEAEEELLESVIADSKQVVSLMKKGGKEPKSIRLIVAEDWKRAISSELSISRSIKSVMEKISSVDGAVQLGIGADGKEKAIKYVQQLAKKINAVKPSASTQEEEYNLLFGAKAYLSASLNCSVSIDLEAHSDSKRASNALPQKPGIDIIA